MLMSRHAHTQMHARAHTLEPDRYRIYKADTDTNILWFKNPICRYIFFKKSTNAQQNKQISLTLVICSYPLNPFHSQLTLENWWGCSFNFYSSNVCLVTVANLPWTHLHTWTTPMISVDLRHSLCLTLAESAIYLFFNIHLSAIINADTK